VNKLLTTAVLILAAGAASPPAFAALKPVQGSDLIVRTPGKAQSTFVVLVSERARWASPLAVPNAVRRPGVVVLALNQGRSADSFAPGHLKQGGHSASAHAPGHLPPCPDGRGHSCEAPGHRKVSPS
jgi:hypothetical protein